MQFYKDLSLLGWEEVRKRQQHRLPLVDEWIKLAQMEAGNSIIDIGPGPGVFTSRYAETVGNTGTVTALEKSQEAIEYLENNLSRTNTNIEVICGDAEEIDLNAVGPFDIIMLTDILHHADSPTKILQNIFATVHTKDSRILISEFDPDSSGEIGPPIHKRLGEKYLFDVLRNTGFTVVDSGKQLYEHYYILAQK
jgi:2-polyprenyl-3-methyl-5-hydroxy-6-metoxy-1,4-benzoquinol methylase